jgi:hypothetical protein
VCLTVSCTRISGAVLPAEEMATQAARIAEDRLRREEEKLREIELRVQREIAEKRQELVRRSLATYVGPSCRLTADLNEGGLPLARPRGDAPDSGEPAPLVPLFGRTLDRLRLDPTHDGRRAIQRAIFLLAYLADPPTRLSRFTASPNGLTLVLLLIRISSSLLSKSVVCQSARSRAQAKRIRI